MAAIFFSLGVAVFLVILTLLWVSALQRRHIIQNRALRQELARLTSAYEALEAKYQKVPGVVVGEKDWHVLVDGQRVAIRPLSGEAWLSTMTELPQFIYLFAQERVKGQGLQGKDFEKVLDLAKKWIGACAVGEVNLDKLTLPEAEHAVTHIAELNGITQQLREFFRQRLETMARAPQNSKSVRGAPQQPARDIN
jgi:hypothetical protein